MRSRAASKATKVLVVWDFDWSLINENSDTWVIEQLDFSGRVWAEGEAKFRRKELDWTSLMDWALGELHANGHSAAAISEALAKLPVLGGALAAVKLCLSVGAEQRILSDANTVYINTILEARNLTDAFAVVETNPASYDDSGRLHVRPHQPADVAPHGCPMCPSNLCKGAVLDGWLAALKPERCVYIGDGGGDFCPATRLRATDFVLARAAPHNSLLRKCRAAGPETVAATVLEWGGDADADGSALEEGMRRALEGAS